MRYCSVTQVHQQHRMPHAKLFVGQLPKHINEDQLRPIFEEYGEIIELAILRDKYTQVHKGMLGNDGRVYFP